MTLSTTVNCISTLLLFLLASPIHANPTSYPCPNSKTNPLVLKGKRFYDSVTGEYVPIKGIAYYPRPNAGELSLSPSVDYYHEDYRERWQEDISYFQQLNINAIRIYAVNPSQWHEGFMCALQEAGIYVLVGLAADCLDCGVGPTEPPDCYSQTLKERGQFIITTFSKYDNLLAFDAGNEVTIFASDRRNNSPCQKKFIRDMRHFVNSCSLGSDIAVNPILPRKIPIGVVGWDNDDVTPAQTNYYGCQTDPNDLLEPMEWYGINTYRHCDPAAQSVEDLGGFLRLKKLFIEHNLNVPILLTEYGCRAQGFPTLVSENTGEAFDAQRTWLQIDMLYSTPEYLDVFAGGFAYEYSAEKYVADRSLEGNPWPYYGYMQLNYGMGYLYPVDCDNIDIICQYEPYPESKLFGEKMAAVDTSFIPSMNEASDQTAGAIPECPTDFPPLSAFVWQTDEDDEAILACTTNATLSPTTLAPTTTVSPTVPSTESPTIAEVSTESPTIAEVTSMPTTQPTVAEPQTDTETTSQPTEGSWLDSTDKPSTIPATFEPTIPGEQPTTAEVQESCMLNPSCAAQNGLRVAGIQSCCPTRDERNLFLDCCTAVADFCYDDAGSITVCRSVSTSQYLSEVITGLRDPNIANTDESGNGSGSAAMTTSLLVLVCIFLTEALMLLSIV